MDDINTNGINGGDEAVELENPSETEAVLPIKNENNKLSEKESPEQKIMNEEPISEKVPKIKIHEMKVEEESAPLEGEVELPHQANEFKPDDIVEIEQTVPEEIITSEERHLADLHDRVNSAFSVLKAEEDRLVNLKNKRESIENKFNQLNKIISEPNNNQTSSENKIDPNSSSLNAKFLQKLSFLRKNSTQKRSLQAEANLNKIMDYAQKNGRVTNNEVEAITGVKNTQAYNYLKMLKKDRKLLRYGSGKLTFYKPNN